MLHRVDVGRESIEDYRSAAGDAVCDRLIDLARQLQGIRILHINATPYGGGVSELLRSSIAIQQGLGLHAEWQVISGDSTFFEVTKGLHNGLQGGSYHLTPDAEEHYLLNNTRNARLLDGEYDVVFVHDPQPAAIPHFINNHLRNAIWIWRCHIDTSEPSPEIAAFLTPYLEAYAAAVFTMAEFVLPSLVKPLIRTMPPGIDPLSPKNITLPPDVYRRTVSWMGVDLDRPLLTQVSRFDPWKDPLGVIRVYRQLKEEIPALQLALIGSIALDDPEGWRIYERIRDEAHDDADLLVATNLTGVSNFEVNAFQHHADVVIQKSIREGFGLVVSETLWKGTPVVAGRASGITLQMPEGTGGFLVDSHDDGAFVDRIRYLLEHPLEGKRLGALGHQVVRERFLITRMVADELELIVELVRARA